MRRRSPISRRLWSAGSGARRRARLTRPALVVGLSIAALGGCTRPPDRYVYAEIIMGVEARITFHAADEGEALDAAAAAFRRMRDLDAVMSDYRDDSELMLLCATTAPDAPGADGPGVPQPIGADLAAVLEAARAVSVRSDGAFDVTVGPLVALWRAARQRGAMPSEPALASAQARTGWRAVTVDRAAGTATLARPDMRLDLGGIGKGYAIDAALETLAAHGAASALVSLGGDLGASGRPPGAAAWRVEARSDLDGAEPIELGLVYAAVATSGDAAQFVEIDGVRYSHIVDPRTGLGLTNRTSVTVIARDATTADAWASALSVLGPEAGCLLAARVHGIEALFETATPDGIRRTATAGFPIR